MLCGVSVDIVENINSNFGHYQQEDHKHYQNMSEHTKNATGYNITDHSSKVHNTGYNQDSSSQVCVLPVFLKNVLTVDIPSIMDFNGHNRFLLVYLINIDVDRAAFDIITGKPSSLF